MLLPTEPRGWPHLVVPGDPLARQQSAWLVQHVQGHLVPGLEAHVPGHAGLVQTLARRSPLLAQIVAEIDQGMSLARDIAEIDAAPQASKQKKPTWWNTF